MCTVILPCPPSGHLIYGPDQLTWSSRGMDTGGAPGRISRGEESESCPLPLTPCHPPTTAWRTEGGCPKWGFWTLASRDSVLDQNRHSPQMQGEVPLEDFGMVYKNSA